MPEAQDPSGQERLPQDMTDEEFMALPDEYFVDLAYESGAAMRRAGIWPRDIVLDDAAKDQP
jgi:hypothetical protein